MSVAAVATIFGRVLGTPAEHDSDFFALGGDSRLATRVLSAIARESGVELTFDEFVAAPTPAGLAATVGGLR